jgi:purine catabolism regulator
MRSDMHSRLADREVPHVLLRHGDTLLVVLNADGPGLDRLSELAGRHAFVGVSSRPVAGVGRIADAVREARLALRGAQANGRRMVAYGENDAPFLPRTIAEANTIVDRILGPLVEYDREHNGDLVHTLEQFLGANRSWQRTAEALYVHKQTLVYRMKRVEELTGRRLDNTGDVAELWFALQALQVTR